MTFDTGKKIDLISFVFKERQFSEEKYIKEISDKTKFNYRTINITTNIFKENLKESIDILEEPFSGLPIISYLLCVKKLAKTKVILDGSGLDEANFGYDKYTNLNSNQVINQTNITSANKAVTLSNGTPYSWKVTSKRNGTAETVESSTWKFYLSGNGISNYPPYPSTLISPFSGHVFPSSTTSVELSWEGSHPENSSLTYGLYIDTTDGLQEPTSSNKNLSAKSKSVQVSSGNSYYWRVKATDSNNNSSYSIVFSFKVD